MVPVTSNVWERDHSGGDAAETLLLADPDLSPDLARLVQRVCQNRQPWVVVAAAALTAWQERDPVGWEKVLKWLAANGVALVRI
jgi:hypothetical protein